MLKKMTLKERRSIAVTTKPNEKALALTTMWCVKEAYVKAIGEGVGFGLERVEVILDDLAGIQSVLVDGTDIRESGWRLESGYLDGGQYRWVCIYEPIPSDSAPESLSPREISWEELTSSITSGSSSKV